MATLSGHHALVTGGGSGIGAAIALALARAGATVTICGRRREPLAAIAAQQAGLYAEPADVTDRDAVLNLYKQAEKARGPFGIVVANAGGAQSAAAEKVSPQLWNDTLNVNLSGAFFSVQPALAGMRERGFGRIVFIASTAGLKGAAYVAPYVAAKHGVIGLMRSFAVELGQHMIRVNAVLPTHVNSPLLMNEKTYRAFRPELENPGPDDLAPVCQSFHVLPIPWVTPEDITNAVLFLSSDEARYITGVALAVDAGSCLK
jgi:NAD(P)-dependent dehydrogenase (short-subunit alcohol dehydrogenase family)